MKPRTAKLNLLTLFVLILGVAIGLNLPQRLQTPSKPVSFRDFMRDVEDGKIETVTIAGQAVSGTYRADRTTFHTFAPSQFDTNSLNARGIVITR
jgi:cell division protease FtsH